MLSKVRVMARAVGVHVCAVQKAQFHASPFVTRGIDDFIEKTQEDGTKITTGRAWTAAELRRKSFDDLHKLWYVLYKERNLLMSVRERFRAADRDFGRAENNRMQSVKRSMAGIKLVLAERRHLARHDAEQMNDLIGEDTAR